MNIFFFQSSSILDAIAIPGEGWARILGRLAAMIGGQA